MKSFNQFIAEAKKLKREPQAIVTEIPEVPCTNESAHQSTVMKAAKQAQAKRNKENAIRQINKKLQDRKVAIQRERVKSLETNRNKNKLDSAKRNTDVAKGTIAGTTRSAVTDTNKQAKYSTMNRAFNARNKAMVAIKKKSDRLRASGAMKVRDV